MAEDLRLSRSRLLLLDTSAFIYFLTGLQPYQALLLPLFRRVQQGQAAFVVSAVTEAELLTRPHRDEDREAVERIEDLLSEDGIEVVAVDRRIGRRAAVLRSEHKLRLADAIIVATAIEMGCDAVVGNDSQWRRLTEVPYVHLDDVVRRQQSPWESGLVEEST